MPALKTQWNLKLLYKSDSDPQIEKDLKNIENECVNFEKKYKNKDFAKTPNTLLKALNDYEKLIEKTGDSKPLHYFSMKIDLNSEDTKSTALLTKYEQRLTEASNKITFFILAIGRIQPSKQKLFLAHSSLKGYKYLLEKIFNNAKHDLSEKEEQLENLLSQMSYSMWIESQEKLLNQQIVDHKGKKIPVGKAMASISHLNKRDRRELHSKCNAVFKSISHAAEGEINAIYNYKKVMDRQRGFKKSYSATILGYENDEKAIENFIALVTKYFKISHRFYNLHAKLLGEKKITLADRAVEISKIKTKFDFPKSVSILEKTLRSADPAYLNIFKSYLDNGQIDVYPKKGKRGGAYCSDSIRLPTFLLLNHVNNVRSLETLAHEMGHAIHTEMSKNQPVRYQGYSTATAEVASTFFEQLIADELEKILSKKDFITLLHNRILGDISSIFRQVACFNFEKELHEKIRQEGQLSKERIAELLVKHLKSYLGDSVEVLPDDGYFFVAWSHIRRFFYVYTYAYGQIISRALYEKWKADPSYAAKIKQFLSAGHSNSPENIFKMIGIDTSKTAFFEDGLKSIEKDVKKLEKLSQNL